MAKLQIMDVIVVGALIGVGYLGLKLFGGVKGIKDMFAGLTLPSIPYTPETVQETVGDVKIIAELPPEQAKTVADLLRIKTKAEAEKPYTFLFGGLLGGLLGSHLLDVRAEEEKAKRLQELAHMKPVKPTITEMIEKRGVSEFIKMPVRQRIRLLTFR